MKRRRSPCPTPLKAAYSSEREAYEHAKSYIRTLIGRGEHAYPMYGYRCVCGRWHGTRQAQHDGVDNVLLWRVSNELQAWAQGKLSLRPPR